MTAKFEKDVVRKGNTVFVKEIGPIKKLELPLRDLSLLLGRPNSGKSYSLRSIYWFLQSLDEKALVRLVQSYGTAYSLETPELNSFQLNEFARPLFDYLIKVLKQLKEEYSLEKPAEQREQNRKRPLRKLNIESFQKDMEIEIRIPREELYENISQLYVKELNKFVGSSAIDHIMINDSNLQQVLKRAINSIVPEKDHIITGRDYHFFLPEFSNSNDSAIAYTIRRLRHDFPILFDFDGKIIGVETNSVRMIVSISLHFDLEKANLMYERHSYLRELRAPLDRYLDVLEKITSEDQENIINYSSTQILEDITKEYHDFVMQLAFDEIRNEIYNLTSFKSVKFFPYGRNLVMQLANLSFGNPYYDSDEIIDILRGIDSTPAANYLEWAIEGKKLINNAPEEFIGLFEPILGGKISYLEESGALVYNYSKGEGVNLGLSSAMVEELAGILLPLLSASESELILIEEPEAQLHVSTQILMGLLLIAIAAQKNLKIVISTHSDLLALVIHYVLELRPEEESLISLIKSLLPDANKGSHQMRWLASAITNMNRRTDSISCFIEQNGKSRIIGREELDKSVPGISSTVDSFYKWTVSELIKRSNTSKESKKASGDNNAETKDL